MRKSVLVLLYRRGVDVENQKIKVRVNNFNEKHFKSLGYNVSLNAYIDIFVYELPIGSGLKIPVECFYCGKIFLKAYRRYLETKGCVCCSDCGTLKMIETSTKRYGSPCSLRNELVQNKSKEKNMKNLGVQFPFQNKDILKKCADSYNKGPNKKEKKTSSQQLYIFNLYGGEINLSIFPYFVDIFFRDNNIYFEYDGSGHKLNVIKGKITEDEWSAKELKRSLFLRNKALKEFRIVSNDDILPSDDKLLEIKDRAFYILLNKNYNKYVYNLNTKTESFEE